MHQSIKWFLVKDMPVINLNPDFREDEKHRAQINVWHFYPLPELLLNLLPLLSKEAGQFVIY